MAYEQKDNSGSLFVNDRREKDSQPNAKGNALIDGVEYWVSAWTKTDRNGNKWQSLSFQPKADRQPANRDDGPRPDRDDPRTGRARDLDDETPF